MKLDKELKDKIDRYFDNISATELYSILKEKYKFQEKDSSDSLMGNDKYLYKKYEYLYNGDMISGFVNNTMYYADIDIKQKVEVVKVKFLEDTLDYKNEEIVENQNSSITFAA